MPNLAPKPVLQSMTWLSSQLVQTPSQVTWLEGKLAKSSESRDMTHGQHADYHCDVQVMDSPSSPASTVPSTPVSAFSLPGRQLYSGDESIDLHTNESYKQETMIALCKNMCLYETDSEGLGDDEGGHDHDVGPK